MATPLDPRLLATFRAVAHAGRISAAAKTLHLSQPAVTAQVRKLEDQCSQPLLVRLARGVTPTDAGRLMLGYAERLEVLLGEASAALAGDGAEAGELSLAASTTIASYVLPPLLAGFMKDAAGVAVRVEVGNTEEVLERVRGGSVPLGLVEGHGRAAGLRLSPFLKDDLAAVVASDAPAELLRVRRAADLAMVPIIWREPGSGTRAVVERALTRAVGRRPPLGRDVQMGATEAIKGAALAGLGVAFLSLWSIRAELALGKLRVLPLRDLAISAELLLGAACRRGGGYGEAVPPLRGARGIDDGPLIRRGRAGARRRPRRTLFRGAGSHPEEREDHARLRLPLYRLWPRVRGAGRVRRRCGDLPHLRVPRRDPPALCLCHRSRRRPDRRRFARRASGGRVLRRRVLRRDVRPVNALRRRPGRMTKMVRIVLSALLGGALGYGYHR